MLFTANVSLLKSVSETGGKMQSVARTADVEGAEDKLYS